jgi:hypothetical protein
MYFFRIKRTFKELWQKYVYDQVQVDGKPYDPNTWVEKPPGPLFRNRDRFKN